MERDILITLGVIVGAILAIKYYKPKTNRMSRDIHIHNHIHNAPEDLQETLEKILVNQSLILKNQETIMTQNERVAAAVAQLDEATNEVANDLQNLRNEVADKVEPATLDKLDASIGRLKVLGQDPQNPVPPVDHSGTVGTGGTPTTGGNTGGENTGGNTGGTEIVEGGTINEDGSITSNNTGGPVQL